MTWLQLQESLRAPSQLQYLVVEKKKKLPRRNGELVITKIIYMRTETNFHSKIDLHEVKTNWPR